MNTRHNDPAVRRVRSGATLLVLPSEMDVAPAEFKRYADESSIGGFYLSDLLAAMFAPAIAIVLVANAYGPDATGSEPVFALMAAMTLPVIFFAIIVPLIRRAAARYRLARINLDQAVEVRRPDVDLDQPNADFRPQWGRESRARANHLTTMWSLAQATLVGPGGIRFRPDYGRCPGCEADDGTWCTESCTLIDRTDWR